MVSRLLIHLEPLNLEPLNLEPISNDGVSYAPEYETAQGRIPEQHVKRCNGGAQPYFKLA
jgi:hypothetical protein